MIAHNTAAGNPFSGGGGISNGGMPIASNSRIVDNSAPGETGAGLLNHNVATLNNTVVSGNSAGAGGGIVNIRFDPTVAAGTVTLHHTDVSGNDPDDCEGC